MGFTRCSILEQLLEPKLRLELQAALQVIRRGFDVVVYSRDFEVREIFKDMVTKDPAASGFLFGESFFFFEELDRNEVRTKPYFLVSDEPLPSGSGFMAVDLPGVEALLPSLSNIVITVLKYFHQEELLDVFDGKRMGRVREVLMRKGISLAIDAIVRQAFHLGVEGDEMAAERAIDEILTPTIGEERRIDIPCEAPAELATRLFRALVVRDGAPHVFIKAALSWYVVNGMGRGLSDASKLLKISRTTLQEHLRLARIQGVDRFFATAIEPTPSFESLR